MFLLWDFACISENKTANLLCHIEISISLPWNLFTETEINKNVGYSSLQKVASLE